jgi:YfiH family protein
VWQLEETAGIKYCQIEEFKETGLVGHCFTTRVGGVSTGSYQSLNLGFHVDDSQKNVRKNRARVCEVLSSDYKELVAGKQVHGDKIKLVTKADIGRGALDYETALDGVDALLTDQPGILLSSYYADCTPIFLLDPEQEVIGLVHAGWRGTVDKIGQQAVLKMREAYGTDISNILVGIGPHIKQDCYQVDETVIEPVKQNFSRPEELYSQVDTDQWKFSLEEANKVQLKEIGVPQEQIIISSLCTHCHPDLFFSYRRDGGETGRMGSFIKLC